MPLPTDLFSLLPGDLGSEYCFTSWQRFNVDMISRARVIARTQTGTSFWNISASTPSADMRIYPWLNLNDGRVYQWSFTIGKWISPRPYAFSQLWTPTAGTLESALWSLDGGDGSDPRATIGGVANPAYVPPTAYTGAMWQVEHLFDGRFPLGVGEIAGSSPAATVASQGTVDSLGGTGEMKHSLTAAEMPPHVHHFTVTANNAASSGTGELTGGEYNSPNDGHFSGDTENAGGVSNGATPPVYTVNPHNSMPPYRGTYIVTPTVRAFYTIP